MGGRDDEMTGEDFHGEKAEMKNGTRTDTIEAAKRRMEKKYGIRRTPENGGVFCLG